MDSMSLFNPRFPMLESPQLEFFSLGHALDITINAVNSAVSILKLVINAESMGALTMPTAAVPNLQEIHFPYLRDCGANTAGAHSVQINSQPHLTIINFPSLKNYQTPATLNINSNTALTLFNAPLWQGFLQDTPASSAGLFGFTGNTAIVALVLPSFQRFSLGINASGCTALASVQIAFDTVTFLAGQSAYTINFSTCALPTAEVNRLLVLMDSNPQITSNKFTISFNGGTNGAPSGAGATAKTSLQAKGCIVNTN